MGAFVLKDRVFRETLSNFMVAIHRGDVTHWYEDGDQKRSCVYQGRKYTLSSKNGIELIAEDWFARVVSECELHIWGDTERFYRDVTLFRLFGIPSKIE
jgi:hypothetical protein